MDQERHKQIDDYEDLDLRDPNKIAGPDFMDDLRAAMREKVQRSMQKHERQSQSINRMFQLIHPEQAAFDVPQEFTDGLDHTEPLDEIIMLEVLKKLRIRDAQGYGTTRRTEDVFDHFMESDKRRRAFTFLRNKQIELGINTNLDCFYGQLMQLETPEEMYRLYLAAKIERNDLRLYAGELLQLYKDTEALEWVANHHDELLAAQEKESVNMCAYYTYASKHKSESARSKLMTAGQAIKNIKQACPGLAERLKSTDFSEGFTTGEASLDAILSTNPDQVNATLTLIEKIQDQTESRKIKIEFEEFFFLNQFIHKHPHVLEKEDWRIGSDNTASQIHPMRLIHQEVYKAGVYNKIGIDGYIRDCGQPIEKWNLEINEIRNYGQFHHLDEDNYFTFLNQFINQLKPLEDAELRDLIKNHFQLDMETLGRMLSQTSNWEKPDFKSKLRILARYRSNHKEKLGDIDLHLAEMESCDPETIEWICRLRSDKAIQFDAIAWMNRYSFGYVEAKIQRLKHWKNNPALFDKARRAGLFSPDFDSRELEYDSFLANYLTVIEYSNPEAIVEDIKAVRKEFPNFKYTFNSTNTSEVYLQVLSDPRIQDTERLKRFIAPFLEKALQDTNNPKATVRLLKAMLSRDILNRNCINEVKAIIEENAENWRLTNSRFTEDLYAIYVEIHLLFTDIETLKNNINTLDISETERQDMYLNILNSRINRSPKKLSFLFSEIIHKLADEADDTIKANQLIQVLLKLSSLRALGPEHLEIVLNMISKHGEKWEKNDPRAHKAIQALFIEASIQTCDSSQGWGELFEALKLANIDLKERQILFARILEAAISNEEFAAINDLSQDSEILAGDYMKEFINKYQLGAKGKTILILCATNEYRDASSMDQLIENTITELIKYEKILDQYDRREIPLDVRASIGMEYEITESTAKGYAERSTNRSLKTDISRLSGYSGTGSGADAVHEIATQPTDNPAALLLEMQLYQELDYIDFNFNGPQYEKGAHGYHLSIGGAHGIEVGWSANLLQNALIMANWGGVNTGSEVDMLSKGRGVNIRQRRSTDLNNVTMFDNATPSVELRCLSIDKKEPFERAVLASHDAAIAIQAVDKYTNITPEFLETMKDKFPSSLSGFEALLQSSGMMKETPSETQTMAIIYAWCHMSIKIMNAIEDHNNDFINDELHGYLNEDDQVVEVEDFGGEHNKKRFDFVARDVNEPLEEYVEKTKVPPEKIFEPVTPDLANAMTRVNNLYLKPSAERGGDTVNAMAMLSVTKLDNQTLEETDGKIAEKSIFERAGKRREGYYSLQGGSEKMIVHSVQRAILDFQKEMSTILTQESRKAA